MKIIEYTNGQGHIDYAPESYLNIGAMQLMATESREYQAMLKREQAKLPNADHCGFCVYK